MTKDIKNFTLVMVIFTLGMAAMLFFEVSAWWIWYIYFAIWTFIEYRIAKNIKLKWYFWALIIIGIIAVDVLVLELVDLVK